MEFHDLGVSAIVLQGGGAELFEVGGTAVAVGVIVLVHVEGLLCLFLDRVLQRVMEQITESSSAGCGADLHFLPGQGPPAFRGAEHRTVLFFLEKSDVGLVAPFTDVKEAFGRIPHNFLCARAVLI